MASNSPVLPILLVGGLAVGGLLAYKAISQRDDTSGFISGVTGQYIDEPSQRVIRTDLRQDAKTERVAERQAAAIGKVSSRQDAKTERTSIRQENKGASVVEKVTQPTTKTRLKRVSVGQAVAQVATASNPSVSRVASALRNRILTRRS